MGRKKSKPLRAKIGADHPFSDVVCEAYRVFAGPAPEVTGVCRGCCMEPDIEAEFFSPPIDELPFEYLRDWYFAACNRPLPKSVWSYLLPRVLEVLAWGEDDPSSAGLEVSLSRFPTGDRSQWSESQWRVLGRFQRMYLERAIASDRGYLDDVLCMFGNASWPLDDVFGQVAAMPDDQVIPRLWNDWCRFGRPQIWITAFWERGGNSDAFAFYTSRAIHGRAEVLALSDTAPPQLAQMASDVASVIERNADWSQSGLA